jgi:hypothetical protein
VSRIKVRMQENLIESERIIRRFEMKEKERKSKEK